MKQFINEIARIQKLAGITIKESQLNEGKDLNSYGKTLFDRLAKNGFEAKFTTNSSTFDQMSKKTREEREKKLAAVLYDDYGKPGDGYIMIAGNEKTHDEIGKILDSIKSELPEGGRHVSNNMWSWQVQGPSLAPKNKAQA